MLDAKRLKAIREEWEKTSPGEWRYDAEVGYIEVPALDSGIMRREPNWDRSTVKLFVGRTDKDRVEGTYEYEDPDGEFIAHSHQNIPALLAEIERLKREALRWEHVSDCETSLHASTLARLQERYAEERKNAPDFHLFEAALLHIEDQDAEIERLKREVNGWVRSERPNMPLPYQEAEKIISNSP